MNVLINGMTTNHYVNTSGPRNTLVGRRLFFFHCDKFLIGIKLVTIRLRDSGLLADRKYKVWVGPFSSNPKHTG